MINLMPGKTLMKFDRQLPVYNWLYPLKGQELDKVSHHEFFANANTDMVRNRALYVHIPFCDTICTFCTLNRGLGSTGDAQIETYVQALLREIQLKGSYAWAGAHPVRTIFFGGGTPSTLTPDQIRRIGRALHDNFDLTRLKEFVFEIEVKSITEEKCAAMREIGVNKARFGLQTFNPVYRELFNITATLEQQYAAAELLGRYFDYTSIDIIYGMHGQTIEDFSSDIEQAVRLGTAGHRLLPDHQHRDSGAAAPRLRKARTAAAQLHAEDGDDHLPEPVHACCRIPAVQRSRILYGCPTGPRLIRTSSAASTSISTITICSPITMMSSSAWETALARSSASTRSATTRTA